MRGLWLARMASPSGYFHLDIDIELVIDADEK